MGQEHSCLTKSRESYMVYQVPWESHGHKREAFQEGQVCTQASGKHARALWEAQASLRRSWQRSYAVRYAVQLWGGSLEGKGLRPVWIIQAGSCSRWKGGNDQVTEQLEPRGVGHKGD